eukprot:5955211-Pyramimonas_sp.AAC.1
MREDPTLHNGWERNVMMGTSAMVFRLSGASFLLTQLSENRAYFLERRCPPPPGGASAALQARQGGGLQRGAKNSARTEEKLRLCRLLLRGR